jgi:hypothetical protein
VKIGKNPRDGASNRQPCVTTIRNPAANISFPRSADRAIMACVRRFTKQSDDIREATGRPWWLFLWKKAFPATASVALPMFPLCDLLARVPRAGVRLSGDDRVDSGASPYATRSLTSKAAIAVKPTSPLRASLFIPHTVHSGDVHIARQELHADHSKRNEQEWK